MRRIVTKAEPGSHVLVPYLAAHTIHYETPAALARIGLLGLAPPRLLRLGSSPVASSASLRSPPAVSLYSSSYALKAVG